MRVKVPRLGGLIRSLRPEARICVGSTDRSAIAQTPGARVPDDDLVIRLNDARVAEGNRVAGGVLS